MTSRHVSRIQWKKEHSEDVDGAHQKAIVPRKPMNPDTNQRDHIATKPRSIRLPPTSSVRLPASRLRHLSPTPQVMRYLISLTLLRQMAMENDSHSRTASGIEA